MIHMNPVIKNIIEDAQRTDESNFIPALDDLRLVIERNTMNRYGDADKDEYLKLFHNKHLIHHEISENDLVVIKYFLFFLLFNFPDRAVLAAKCIKVLFDESVRSAICAGIETYLKRDDNATCELIFAITNIGDIENYLGNERIKSLFIEISRFGGEHSKAAVIQELSLFKKGFDSNLTW